MLSIVVFLPLLASVLLLLPQTRGRPAGWIWIATAAADLALVVALWAGHDGVGLAYEVRLRWIPALNAGYHVGVDGLSLPLVALTSLLFLVCAIYSLGARERTRPYTALFLFLQTVCLGLFVSLDLLLFFVFFDLSIVGMYFVIAGWGHGDRARAALKFFLYTFLGSLVLLLGFIGLYLGRGTFDMVEIIRNPPFLGEPIAAGLVLLAVFTGLAIKTPTVPFHTWLPPAHTDAPATGSAILAGVLLKMGTYGFARIAMPMLPEAWQRYAWVIIIIGVIGVVYGALVALAQQNVKRLIAYTSVNHMGYIVLALGVAGLVNGDPHARHIAATAPIYTAFMAVAAFASLGLPGLSGFIAEFQIFAGVIGTGIPGAAVAGVISTIGILITAALFLRVLQKGFLGPPGELRVTEIKAREAIAIAPLLLLSLAIGVAPRWLLDMIEPACTAIVSLVTR